MAAPGDIAVSAVDTSPASAAFWGCDGSCCPPLCLLAFPHQMPLRALSAAVASVLNASPSPLFSSCPFVAPVATAHMLIVCSQ